MELPQTLKRRHEIKNIDLLEAQTCQKDYKISKLTTSKKFWSGSLALSSQVVKELKERHLSNKQTVHGKNS